MYNTAGTRIAEVLALQLHEGRGRRVIVLRQFQGEAVGLVFHVAAERQPDGHERKRDHLHQQQDQRQRGHVGELVEAKPLLVPLEQHAGEPVDQVQPDQDADESRPGCPAGRGAARNGPSRGPSRREPARASSLASSVSQSTIRFVSRKPVT